MFCSRKYPPFLRADVYAVAALAGAAVMAAGFLLRMVAVWQHWSLPKAG